MKKSDIECYDLAHKILGELFIMPEKIEKTTGLIYGDEQKKVFISSFFELETLLNFRDRRCLLCAGPPRQMSILNMVNSGDGNLNINLSDWMLKEWVFLRDELVNVSWLVLPYPNYDINLRKICLIKKSRMAVGAAEIIWCMMCYSKITKKQFLDLGDEDDIITTSYPFHAGDPINVSQNKRRAIMLSNGHCGP